MKPENTPPASNDIATPSATDQTTNAAIEDAETKEILYIIHSKPEQDMKGFGKWFWIALPVAFIFGHYSGLNLRHKFLFISWCMAAMFSLRAYELLIGLLVKRNCLSLRVWPTRLVLYSKYLYGFIVGFCTWGGVFMAFFNHQH